MVCRFYDDDPKKDIYHCPHCGLCRRGRGLDIDFFHCFTCGACLSVDMRNHKCIENNFKSDWHALSLTHTHIHTHCSFRGCLTAGARCSPICHQPIFTSTEPSIFLRCQHLMHDNCFKQYIRTNFRCPVRPSQPAQTVFPSRQPRSKMRVCVCVCVCVLYVQICSKSIGNMSETFEMLNLIVQQNRMPPEFDATKANILCNDCQAKTTVPYHFIAHRCSECDSFNTRILTTENFPTYNATGTAIAAGNAPPSANVAAGNGAQSPASGTGIGATAPASSPSSSSAANSAASPPPPPPPPTGAVPR
jgi:hypothetical protein